MSVFFLKKNPCDRAHSLRGKISQVAVAGPRRRRTWGLPSRSAVQVISTAGPQKAAGLGGLLALADKEALPLAEPTYSHLHSPDSAAVPLPRGGAINPRPRRRRRRRRRRTRDVALREVGSAGHPCAAFSLLVLNISFRERDLTLAPSASPRGRPL